MLDLTRFDKEVGELEKKPVLNGQIVFYGSSTFTLWQEADMKAMLGRSNVVNLGFGGSTAQEAWHYSERLLFKHNPSAVCYYEGDNDPACGMTPQEAFEYSRLIFDKLCVPVFVVAVKHSKARAQYISFADSYNNLCREYCKNRDNFYFADIGDFLYRDGELRDEIFMEDNLHFNKQGNEELAKKLSAAFKDANEYGYKF